MYHLRLVSKHLLDPHSPFSRRIFAGTVEEQQHAQQAEALGSAVQLDGLGRGTERDPKKSRWRRQC